MRCYLSEEESRVDGAGFIGWAMNSPPSRRPQFPARNLLQKNMTNLVIYVFY